MKKAWMTFLMTAALSLTFSLTALAGWNRNENGWWYVLNDGRCPANEWQYINGAWYYFLGDGYMATGWQFINGVWYYLDDEDGWMHHDEYRDNGWIGSNGAWTQTATSPYQAGGQYYSGDYGDTYDYNTYYYYDPGVSYSRYYDYYDDYYDDSDNLNTYYWYDSNGDVWFHDTFDELYVGPGTEYYITDNGRLRRY